MPLRLQLPNQLSVPNSWTEAATFTAHDNELEAAATYFRGALGERWGGWQQRFHLARSFHTSLQNGPREWVRLFRLAHTLRDTPNLELVVKDLGSVMWTKHIAAEQALEFCGRLQQAGHRVELIRNTDDTSPDIRVWLQDRPVTVEFKALHDPDERTRWTAFEDALFVGLMQRCAPTAPDNDWALFAAQFDWPALVQLEAVVDRLWEIIDARCPTWSALPGGAGSARFAALEDPQRGYRLPVAQRDDLSRIHSNLRSKWVEQLRSVDGPTLLVVLTHDMFFGPGESVTAEVQRVTGQLRKVLADRRMLGAVLLHEEPFLPTYATLQERGEGWRFEMGGAEGRARSLLLMQNAAAHVPLDLCELDPLVGALRVW